jgi:hypothetical protein
MRLTREQWEILDKMSIKERVERLEELADEIESEQSDIRMKEIEKEFDSIDEECDNHYLRTLIVAMILV